MSEVESTIMTAPAAKPLKSAPLWEAMFDTISYPNIAVATEAARIAPQTPSTDNRESPPDSSLGVAAKTFRHICDERGNDKGNPDLPMRAAAIPITIDSGTPSSTAPSANGKPPPAPGRHESGSMQLFDRATALP